MRLPGATTLAATLAATLAVGAGRAALAADAVLEEIAPAFTGTIVSTYPDGRTSRLWLYSNGAFVADGRAHERQAGRWRIRGRAVCMSQLKPVPIPFLSYCAPIPADGVTTSWTGKAVTGEPISIRLVPDRAGAPAG